MRDGEADVVDRAIGQLVMKRFCLVEEQRVEVALVVRHADWRPVRAWWWRGKGPDCSIIAVDINGNFFLRMASGAVLYRDHQADTEISVANSVRTFFESLESDA